MATYPDKIIKRALILRLGQMSYEHIANELRDEYPEECAKLHVETVRAWASSGSRSRLTWDDIGEALNEARRTGDLAAATPEVQDQLDSIRHLITTTYNTLMGPCVTDPDDPEGAPRHMEPYWSPEHVALNKINPATLLPKLWAEEKRLVGGAAASLLNMPRKDRRLVTLIVLNLVVEGFVRSKKAGVSEMKIKGAAEEIAEYVEQKLPGALKAAAVQEAVSGE
jgi:hypothetical protein